MKRSSSQPVRNGTPKVSCIIPAYNEAERIAAVLEAAEAHSWLNQIIVVCGGSTNGTSAAARRHRRVTVLDKGPARGKSFAVMQGLRAARNDIIMMLDADLIGLTPRDLDELMRPVVAGEADVTMSIRGNALLIYRLLGIDYICGDRVFRKDAFRDRSKLGGLKGYGIEVFFNSEIIRRRLRLRIVRWPGVIGARKREKRGFFGGFIAEWRMSIHIFRTVGILRTFSQVWRMRALSRAGIRP